MAFTKRTWKDRISEFAGRRRLTDIDTNEQRVVDVEREEGFISQVGDAYSANNMNDLEQRIADGFSTCLESQDIKRISVVSSLPSDAADHPDIAYFVLQ